MTGAELQVGLDAVIADQRAHLATDVTTIARAAAPIVAASLEAAASEIVRALVRTVVLHALVLAGFVLALIAGLLYLPTRGVATPAVLALDAVGVWALAAGYRYGSLRRSGGDRSSDRGLAAHDVSPR
jgi:hypothetical protein